MGVFKEKKSGIEPDMRIHKCIKCRKSKRLIFNQASDIRIPESRHNVKTVNPGLN